MKLQRGRRIWIGGVGVGLELVFVAAVAIGMPRGIWAGPLVIGVILLLYALWVGESTVSEPVASRVQAANGGRGPGHVRGNVFGDNTTVNIAGQVPESAPPTERKLARISPSDLLHIYKEHTHVQADKVAEAYIGAWLRVVGAVSDVTLSGRSDGHLVSIEISGTDEFAFAQFPESAQEQLPMLRRGDPVEVFGRISKVSGLGINLEDSEFVD